MFFVTEDATIICKHPVGVVQNKPSQDWLTIVGRRVLIEPDPENRDINGCTNSAGVNVPCKIATNIQMEGYSELIRVDGHRLCLDTITAFTSGQPPGMFKWVVVNPGQPFVEEAR